MRLAESLDSEVVVGMKGEKVGLEEIKKVKIHRTW